MERGLDVPTEPITIPATFAGFRMISCVALSVPSPPVPVKPGWPGLTLLRTTPPSVPVPAAADWACAKMEVEEAPPVRVRDPESAVTGTLVPDSNVPDDMRSARDALEAAAASVIDGASLAVPVVAANIPPADEA